MFVLRSSRIYTLARMYGARVVFASSSRREVVLVTPSPRGARVVLQLKKEIRPPFLLASTRKYSSAAQGHRTVLSSKRQVSLQVKYFCQRRTIIFISLVSFVPSEPFQRSCWFLLPLWLTGPWFPMALGSICMQGSAPFSLQKWTLLLTSFPGSQHARLCTSLHQLQ